MPIRASHIAGLISIIVTFGIGIGSARAPQAGESFRNGVFKNKVVSATTPHLEVRATLSDTEVASGARISIALDIRPKAKMHLYAPGGSYRAVAVRVESQPSIQVHDVVYPKPEDYFFAPLNEHAQVYSEPFRLALDLTVAESVDLKAPQRLPSRLTIKGSLEYQACDDKFCYLPTSVPFQWTLKINR